MKKGVRRGRFANAGLRTAAFALGLIVIVGCADPALWPRWVAERDFWHARRLVDRIRVNPRFAKDSDYERAAEAFSSIGRRFPPSAWGHPALPGAARDVAIAAGRSAIAIAKLDEMRGRVESALAGYARAEQEWRAVPSVALEAAIARALVLERAGRASEALEAWGGIAAGYPMVDDERGEVIEPVMDAPLRVAAALERAGRRAGADSVMALAEHRYESELVTRRGGPAAPALLERISRARAQRGDQQGAMAALRAALNEPAALTLQPRLVLALANRALDQGRPDTALVYANWAQSGFEGRARPEALLLAAQAWEIRGTPDSALVLYQRFLDSYSQAPEASAKARFRRGMILEGLSRWEQARTEYRALAAAQPTHPLAFASLLRIVNHHASRGENDLARAEGRRAVETLDQILATERDEGISLDARVTRARLLAAIGADGEACDTFEDVWKRYESTPEGAAAALEAAVLAERALHDPARAVQIYQGVAARVADPAARQAAHAALIRLGGTHR